ncbi:hypothetical protein ACFYM0_08675 [Streptomyces sp. NPDC006487]|uniref:hypothetical protein n=1 Tax=Streptomyces sp. NPDC006487 TaxID=3364748 RepID=UPI00369D584D
MPTSGSGARHVKELALFLSVYRDAGPAILWPEHDHPSSHPEATAADLAVLEAELSTALGTSVRITHDAPDAPRQTRQGPDSTHTLVQQLSGGGDWTLHPGTGNDTPTAPFHCRLRAGELLYVPPGRAWTADLSASARYLLIHIEPAA